VSKENGVGLLHLGGYEAERGFPSEFADEREQFRFSVGG
jgi:hypothetical protein